MRRIKACAFILVCATAIITNGSAVACRISADFSASMPLNAIEIDNEARVRLADTVISTRAWADEALASVIMPALPDEKKPKELAQERGASIKAYLLALGLREQNIVVDARVRRQVLEPSKEARERFRDVYIEFTPNCDGHCAQLCDGSYKPPEK
jgi:hypothetical protein